MPRIFAIFFVLILVLCGIAQKVFKVPLTKHYANNYKVSDNYGKFHLSSTHFQLYDEEDDADIESEIINMYNISYFGKLWFSHSKPTNQLEFMFDTGSSWLWAGTYE